MSPEATLPETALPEAGLPSPSGRGAGGEGHRFAWLAATRPRTLPAAAVPVMVGTALAHLLDAFAPGPALAALVGALAIQVGTNFANDLFDGKRGADGPDRKGPPRMVATGRITPRAMGAGCALAFALASACGVFLAFHAGWPVVAIGVASILSGLAYTGGPYPLAYHGLGDLFVLVFFGPVAVGGTLFVQANTLPPLVWPLALSVGALATALLVVNNLRDIEEDRKSAKHTLAVLLGRDGALFEHALLLALAYAMLLAPVAYGAWPLLLGLATLPLALRRHRRLRAARTGPEFNTELAATGKLLTLHGLALVVGLLLMRL